MADKQLKEVDLLGNCLLVAIRRGERNMIPRGDTGSLPGDILVLKIDPSQEAPAGKVFTWIATGISP